MRKRERIDHHVFRPNGDLPHLEPRETHDANDHGEETGVHVQCGERAGRG